MNPQTLSGGQLYSVVLLRVLIGWHFLYEGVLKMYSPSWTAKGYLLSATALKPFFIWLADASRISVIDTINIVALLVVGATLLVGFKARWSCVAGAVLLLLYYLAHPPFPSLPQGPSEGSYWIVNKNIIEMAALYVVFQFPTTAFSIESLMARNKAIPV